MKTMQERFDKKECPHFRCNGCIKCGGWKDNHDVEISCTNNSCECHSKCDCDKECDGECVFQEPYGFVPHEGCPLHNKITEEERKSYNSIQMNEDEKNMKELFDMVYNWGRFGITTDYKSNAFKISVKSLIETAKKEERGRIVEMIREYAEPYDNAKWLNEVNAQKIINLITNNK